MKARRLGAWLVYCSPILSFHVQAAVTDIDYGKAGIKPLSSEHTFFQSIDGGLRLKAGLSLYAAAIATDDVNFGSDRSIDGAAPTQQSPAWWEAAAKPGLLGEWDMQAGTLFGGVQGSFAMTRGSRYGDAAGATPGHPENGRLDRAYLGWRSGKLWADSLGKDALTLSLGRQKFIFGDGFLIGDGYTDLGKYAGYYIGPSEAFAESAVASLDTRGWHGDLFYLKADQYVSAGKDNETSLNGGNVDYTWGERAKFGAAYLDIHDSDIATRDGMKVYNLRAKGVPLAEVSNLALGGQWVRQKNDDEGIDATGWYAQLTYTFEDAPLQPQLAYRRAEFSENYDTLFYDFAGGWGNWFMGEIVGEYMLFNSNLDIDMIRASIQPCDDLETGLIGYHFRYHDTQAAGVSDSDFAKELNLYADWTITDKFSLSAVYAVAFPDDGASERFMGNDETAQLLELYAYYRF